MRRGVGALLVAFLAARIFLSPPATSSQSTASPASPQQTRTSLSQSSLASKSANSKTTSAALPNGAPCDACETRLEKHPAIGLSDAVNASLGKTAPKLDLAGLWDIDKDSAKNAHFLIATVPDPVHTHLGLLFDRQIVAIEEAVQQGGYLFTRAYLPWDHVRHEEDTYYLHRLEEQDYQSDRESYPGVLLFHNAENVDSETRGLRPLLVFLVTETPTGGINKEEFRTAMEAIKEICSFGCTDPPPEKGPSKLFILGPTFSGSLYSLHAVIREFQAQLTSVTIHSGTATDDRTIRWFKAASQKDFTGVSISFRTFEESTAYALHHLLGFVCGQGYSAEQMTVLSEDETAYGNLQYGNVKEDKVHPSNSEACPNDGSSTVLHIYFPRDISALRNAYQQDSKASGTSNNPAAPRTTLSLNLGDHGNDDDTVASFAPGQTPLSEEAVMMGIVSDLREHRTNLVVIEATNPLDIVFLVRYLRVGYPGARILTVGSDLLLPRQVDDPRLRGVMQISSYSLIPEIDRYTTSGPCGQPSSLNRIFPSDYSVGTFNALLSLMEFQGSALNSCPQRGPIPVTPPGKMNELGAIDLPIAAYAQYGWPTLAGPHKPGTAELVPPLWLTILGFNQFWPVELLDGLDLQVPKGETSSFLHAVPSSPPDENKNIQPPSLPRLPVSWIVVCVLGAVFALLYALLALSGKIRSASTFLANFAPVNSHWRNVVLLICGLLIFDILFCLLRPWFWFHGPTKWVALIIIGVVCLMILRDLGRRGGWRLATVSLLPGAASFLILKLAFGIGSGPLQNFMRYRYVNVTSGVSPVIPFLFLFAGCLWACWYSLSGRPPWDRKGKGPPLPLNANIVAEFEDRVPSPTDSLADQVRLFPLTAGGNVPLLKAMEPMKLCPEILVPTLLALAILVLSLIGPAPPYGILSFEGRSYNITYTCLIILAFYILLTDVFRLRLIWLELRRLLMALDRLPLRRSFARMVGLKSKRLWQLGGNTSEDFFAIMSKEFQALSALANSSPVSDNVFYKLGHTRAEVAGFMLWFRSLTKENMKEVTFTDSLANRLRRLQIRLAGTCTVILRDLNRTWRKEARPVWEAECIVREKSECKDPDLPVPVRLAEDFVCLFYFNFISSVFTRMRSLVLTIAGLYVFILLSFSSYPFEPSSTFHMAMIFLLLLIAVVVGIVYGQAHKDATISRITETTPGELGIDFWFRLAAVMAVPLLSLLAAKFPELGGFLFSWLAPASQAFR